MGPTYVELVKWIQKNGKQIVGPLREVYINDPGVVLPEEIVTEIYAPVN
ncbi:MAG: GyrI-like domain-containing protein [Chloroflexota bacterium]